MLHLNLVPKLCLSLYKYVQNVGRKGMKGSETASFQWTFFVFAPSQSIVSRFQVSPWAHPAAVCRKMHGLHFDAWASEIQHGPLMNPWWIRFPLIPIKIPRWSPRCCRLQGESPGAPLAACAQWNQLRKAVLQPSEESTWDVGFHRVYNQYSSTNMRFHDGFF